MDELIVCNSSDTLALLIFNNAENPLEQVLLSIDFDPGLSYGGFVFSPEAGQTVSEFNVSNLSKPVFSVSDIEAGGYVIAYIGIQADCDINVEGGTISLDAQLDYNISDSAGNSLQCTDINQDIGEYNSAVKIPVLNFLSISPQEVVLASSNAPKCHTLKISQDGLQAYVQDFTFEVEGIDFNLFTITSLTANGINLPFTPDVSNQEIIVNIDGTYFPFNTGLSNGDDLFNEDEQVTVQMCYTVDGCVDDDLSLNFKTYYGCNNDICFNVAEQSGAVSFRPSYGANVVSTSAIDQFGGICGNDLIFDIGVKSANTDPVDGLWTDVVVRFNACLGANLSLKDIMLNGFALPSSAISVAAGTVQVDFTQVNTNVDTPNVGIEDLDGDGVYDDLAGGQELNFSIVIEVGCADDSACTALASNINRVEVRGKRNCGQDFQQFSNLPTPVSFFYGETDFSTNDFNDPNDCCGLAITEDFTTSPNVWLPTTNGYEFSYDFGFENIQTCSSGGDLYLVARVDAPQRLSHIRYEAGSATYQGNSVTGVTTQYIVNSDPATGTMDTLFLEIKIPAGNLSDISHDYYFNLEMEGFCAPSNYMYVNYQVVEECDCGGPEPCEIIRSCHSSTTYVRWRGRNCECYFRSAVDSIARVNYGFADKEMTMPLSQEDVPLVDQRRFIPGDTMFLRFHIESLPGGEEIAAMGEHYWGFLLNVGTWATPVIPDLQQLKFLNWYYEEAGTGVLTPIGMPDCFKNYPDDIQFNSNGETNVDDDIIDNTNGDEDDHDLACVIVEQDFDLALKKEYFDYIDVDNNGYLNPGDLMSYQITVYNQGSLDATNIRVVDYISPDMNFSGVSNPNWTSIGAQMAQTVIGAIPAGSSYTINIELEVDPNFMGSQVINNAEITSAENLLNQSDADDDINLIHGFSNDNSQLATDDDIDDDHPLYPGLFDNPNDVDDYDIALTPVGQVFDLALIKKVEYNISPDTIYPGGLLTFEIDVINQGTLDAYNVQIVDYIPSELTLEDPNWNEVFNKAYLNTPIPFIGVGQTETVYIQFRIDYEYRGLTDIINRAEISQADDDQDPNNGFATDIDSTPDGVEGNDTEGGNNIVQNQNGDEDDHDPELLPVDLFYDFALDKKESSAGPYKYGDLVSFDFTLTNQGALPGINLQIVDYLPCGFEFDKDSNPDWSYDSATRKAYYVYNDTIEVHQSRSFQIHLQVRDCKNSEAWVNTSEIIEGADPVTGLLGHDKDSFGDQDPSNDGNVIDNEIDQFATEGGDEDDHDIALVDIFDLALRKIALVDGIFEPGDIADFEIWIFNQGNQSAYNINVVDYLTNGFVFDQLNNPIWSPIASNIQTTISGPLAPGDSIKVDLELEIAVPTAATVETWYNYSEIISSQNNLGQIAVDADSQGDLNNQNDNQVLAGTSNDNEICESNGMFGSGGDDEDDHDVEDVIVGYDLALRKKLSTVGPYQFGQELSFTISLYNQGGSTPTEIEITDYIPCGYQFVSGSNPDWFYNPSSGFATYIHKPALYPSDSVEVELKLIVQQCNNGGLENYMNIAEISGFLDFNGNAPLTGDIDSTPDDDPNNDGDWINNEIYGNASIQEDEDDHDGVHVEILDLALRKMSVDEGPHDEGEVVQFVMEVFNQGNIEVTNIQIVDYIRSGFAFDASINPNWSMGLDGNLYYNSIASILPGDSKTIDLFLEIVLDGDPDVEDWYNYAEISDYDQSLPDSDSNMDNNESNDNPLLPGDDNDNEIDENAFVASNAFGEQNDEDDHDVSKVEVTGDLCGFIWEDCNGDGIQNDANSGMANVEVEVYDELDNLIGTTSTNASGFYIFENLHPDKYYIKIDKPQDYLLTMFRQGTVLEKDSDVNEVNGSCTSPISFVGAGNCDPGNFDAGLFTCISLGESVWYDINQNSIKDSYENGINGMPVELYRLENGTWNLYAVEMTGNKPGTPSEDGYFKFCAPPGTYRINMLLPETGLVPVIKNMGANAQLNLVHPNESNVDSDLSFNQQTDPFNLTCNLTEVCNIGAGYFPMAQLGNRVWYDLNGDGMQSGSEPGAAGVKIEAYNSNHDMVNDAITDASGAYNIDYLGSDDYYLKITPPNGYGLTSPNMGGDELMDSDFDNSNGFMTTGLYSLSPGDQVPHVDAGLVFGVVPVEWLSFTGENRVNHTMFLIGAQQLR